MERRKPNTCRVCAHRELAQIDLSLTHHVSIRALSKRYGVSIDSLYRHQARHLSPALRAKLLAGPAIEGLDLEKLRSQESQSLLANLIALRRRLYASLDVAEESGDVGMVARIARALHDSFELVGKLLGELSTGSVTNNILVQPEFLEVRCELTRALRPFPEARRAVASVLHKLESKAGNVIEAEASRELAR